MCVRACLCPGGRWGIETREAVGGWIGDWVASVWVDGLVERCTDEHVGGLVGR